jgi:hypothetical protein
MDLSTGTNIQGYIVCDRTQKSTHLDVDIKRNASTDPIIPIDFGSRGKIIASRGNRT